MGSIRSKGARLAVPGLVDLSEFATAADGVARIVLKSVQELLLKLALQMARDDYETRRERQRQGVQLAKAAGKYAGRIPDAATHQRIIALRGAGQSIKRTAKLAGCSERGACPRCASGRWKVGSHQPTKPRSPGCDQSSSGSDDEKSRIRRPGSICHSFKITCLRGPYGFADEVNR